MSKLLEKTAATLAANASMLKKIDEASDAKIGKKGGISGKTINNIVNQNTNPTLRIIVGIAEAYGVEPWQLLHPDFRDAMPSETYLEQTIKALSQLSDVEFAAVLRAGRSGA